jgi:eukaryotic-like serine/threonine-protein kinase
VRKLASSFLFEFHDSIRDLPGSTPARELLVRRALEYLGTLAKEAGNDPALQRELANAYERLGEIQISIFGQSLGNTEGALASLGAAKSIRETLFTGHPGDRELEDALAANLQKLGEAYLAAGELPRATEAAGRAVSLHTDAAGRGGPAGDANRRALAAAHQTLGNSLWLSGDFKGAMESFRRQAALLQSLLDRNPRDPGLQRSFAQSQYKIAVTLAQTGAHVEALALYERAFAIQREAADADPTNASLRLDLALTLCEMGGNLLKSGRTDEGVNRLRESLAAREAVAAADPKDLSSRQWLAVSHSDLGRALAGLGRREEGLEHLRKALEILEEIGNLDRSNSLIEVRLAQVLQNLGEASSPDRGDPRARDSWTRAREWYRKSLEAWTGLRERGKLVGRYAAAPDRVTAALARCDAALASKGSRNPKPSATQ